MARCGQIFATWDELKILSENDDNSCIDVEVIEISDSSDEENEIEVKNKPIETSNIPVEIKTDEPMTVDEITPVPEISVKFGNDECLNQTILVKLEDEHMDVEEATALREISSKCEKDDNSSQSENSPENIMPCFTSSVRELVQNRVMSESSCTSGVPTSSHQSENSVSGGFLPFIMKTESLSTSSPDSTKDELRVSNFCAGSDNWSGPHNFNIYVKYDASVKRNESALFCKSRRKLYASKDIPFFICCSAQNVPPGTILRTMGMFKFSIHSIEIVKRCPFHAQQDADKGIIEYEHLIQSLSEFAKHEKNSTTGRYSCVIPYKPPKEGFGKSVYVYKLTCFNSCVGGLNRRPFTMRFSLEKDGCELGRQSIDVKVCACPKRDIKYESKVKRKRFIEDISLQKYVPKSSSENANSNNYTESNNCFTIEVDDLELYEFLKEMKTFFLTSHSAIKSFRNRQTDSI